MLFEQPRASAGPSGDEDGRLPHQEHVFGSFPK